LLVSGGGVVSN